VADHLLGVPVERDHDVDPAEVLNHDLGHVDAPPLIDLCPPFALKAAASLGLRAPRSGARFVCARGRHKASIQQPAYVSGLGIGGAYAGIKACITKVERPRESSLICDGDGGGRDHAAWGFTFDGRKVLLHLMAGSKEDAETVSAFFQDIGDPLLVVSDGAAGIIKAIEVCFPRSTRQRCPAHQMRNLAAKLPEDWWPEFRARATAAYQAPEPQDRPRARRRCRRRLRQRSRQRGRVLMDDFEACIAHLRLPISHRRATRTTNLLERLFVEERRRLKIIPNAFGEKAVLKLMFGAMTRAAERWRSIRVSEFERRQMTALRQELDHDYEAAVGLDPPRSKPAPATEIPSRSRT
jgi:hypothetical protein